MKALERHYQPQIGGQKRRPGSLVSPSMWHHLESGLNDSYSKSVGSNSCIWRSKLGLLGSLRRVLYTVPNLSLEANKVCHSVSPLKTP